MVAYNRCLQITFILVQLFFIAVGGVLIGIGSFLTIQEQEFDAIIEEDEIFYGPYILIAAGCGIMIVAVLGMIGACCDYKLNRYLLFVYIGIVIMIFAAQLAGGIIGFVYREQVFDIVRDGLNETLPRYAGNGTANASITRAWDYVQEELECCGIMNVSDWIIADIPALRPRVFPVSCCTSGNCNSTDEVFTTGCEDALSDFIEEYLLIIAALGVSFVVAEVIVVLMAVCLVCCTEFDQ